ncbi:hypothetical protein BJ170DRAFT_580027 [Xylariales sp. AK1849]|nr:hypothetical protein BJ170DRAFT_580027 [Xylariales sp. AK1849]
MSEDVSKFLLQVKELGDRRVEEDEARSRELEEKILQDRKERQARRAERARSISPQKSSPANTPPPSAHRTSMQGSQRLDRESSPILQPPASPQSGADLSQPGSMSGHGAYSASASKENDVPFDADNKGSSGAVSPTRSNTTARGLSWQRRPNSQASNGSRSRPLSMVAAENAARSSTTPSEPSPAIEAASRDQIAQALSSKDPSWFRQTADRGTTSGAYRKNQVEDEERMDMSSAKAQLPGMARGPSIESVQEERGSPSASPGLQRTPGSPLQLTSSQRLDPPKNDSQPEAEPNSERQSLMSPPPLGRISPSRQDRPVSPTKGMGGFVQSAMMKRSDSVNKRWSVQSPAGLQRADSVASNRASYDPNRNTAASKSRPSSMFRETSVEANSRPSSSQGEKHIQGDESISRKISDSLKLDTKVSPDGNDQDDNNVTPPSSPSKTTDPRRWSPTKASWLESALNKPESPKPKPTPPPSNQPSWMAELAKTKAQKAANPSTEMSRVPMSSPKHNVSVGGLMRSSAPGITANPTPVRGMSGPSTPTLATHRTGSGGLRNSSLTSTAAGEAETEANIIVNRSSTSTPVITARPKPETPPKKDFRANLKPRQQPSTSGGTGNPEFKNVFGTLRKTTTQNYVAPDELKDNITRGKAGLNITGGPKKTERKDEFKDAILAKKKEFQKAQVEGKGVTRSSSTASETPIPEGLAKILELGRSNTVSRTDSAPLSTPTLSARTSLQEKRDSIPDAGSFEARRPGIGTKRESAQEAISPKPTDDSTAIPTLQKETSAPGRLQGKMGGGALANRFNPALAGLLARGPPPMASGPSNGIGGEASQGTSAGATAGDGNETGSAPKLTHMTKGRARGPKRKAPSSLATTVSTATTATVLEVEEEPPTPKGELSSPPLEKKIAPAAAPKPVVISLVDSSKKSYDYSPRPKPQPITLVGSAKPTEVAPDDFAAKLPSPVKTHVRSQSRIHEQIAALAASKTPPSPTKPVETNSQPPSPRKLDMKRMSKFADESSQAVEKSPVCENPKEIKPALEDPKPRPLSSKPRSPEFNEPEVRSPPPIVSGRPLPTPDLSSPKKQQSADEAVDSAHTVSVQSGANMFGGRALPSMLPPSRESTPVKPRPLPLETQASSRPLPSPGLKSPAPTASPMRSPTKQAMEVTTILTEFFGSNRPKRDLHVDSAALLMQRPNISAPKIRTLDAKLFRFTAEGKKVSVPNHHERVLFEREMYLCSHTLNNEAGKRSSEVYFWAGDEVPSTVIEDVSIFVAREARSLGGKLIKLGQSKETPEFIAALGGIMITRRGSSNKYDSLAPHMLCGRRYHGQIVFDEVDFTPAALCSGFPYLITSAGSCYLWKGKGSGVDELSCARLIGMDYALSGEMAEVEDGREPANFWDLFRGGSKMGSADHWRLKPNYDKYCSRLFCSDAASKQQIVELSPFSQTDIQPTGIYVLDAFFELYIIVGSRAQPQYASFYNALEFAQEYAILAAGMEDRPFVPISTVVLEGIPKDMKSVFRKWRDADSPTITNAPGSGTGLRRGRSLRIVPLNQALQALSE